MYSKEISIKPNSELYTLPTDQFLDHITSLSTDVTQAPDYHDSNTGYISDSAWHKMIQGGILLNAFNERNLDPETRRFEILEQIRILANKDFDLSLTMGITQGLVSQTLDILSHSDAQRSFWQNKLKEGDRPSFGVTELHGSGSAALQMQSEYYQNEDGTVTVNFAKHFQGQSQGPWMIVFAKGDKRSIGAIVVPKEHFESEPIDTIAIKGISYARNIGSATLDADKHLLTTISPREYSRFQELFIRSRLALVALTHGHLEKVAQEARAFAQTHLIYPKKQIEYPLVQKKLSEIHTLETASQVLYDFTAQNISFEPNQTLSHLLIHANLIKALGSEMALKVSDTRVELLGARAYDTAHPAYNDRSSILAVTIFEGPNDKLYLDSGTALLSGQKQKTSEGRQCSIASFASWKQGNNLYDYFLTLEASMPEFPFSQAFATLDQTNINRLATIHNHQPLGDIPAYYVGKIAAKLFVLSHQYRTEMNTSTRANLNKYFNEEIRKDLFDLHTSLQN